MYTLLIADDDLVTREGLVRHVPFAKLGISTVRTTDDGQNALALCTQIRPDIVLSDIRMPRMDGIAFVTALRRELPDTVVLFMSAFTEKEYFKSAIQLRAIRFVEKPIDMEEMVTALTDAVAQVQARHPEPQVKNEPSADEEARATTLTVQNPTVQAVMRYTRRHFSDPSLSVETLSAHVGLSAAYLSALFRQATGDTLNRFITDIRIGHAKKLLHTHTRVGKIAKEVGFYDSDYFAKVFRKHTGMTPSDYRKRLVL